VANFVGWDVENLRKERVMVTMLKCLEDNINVNLEITKVNIIYKIFINLLN